MIKVTQIAVLTSVLALWPVAKAEEATSSSEYVLTYSYAELTSDSGRDLVLRRIVRAAKSYCPSYSKVRSLDAVRTCIEGVVEDLVAKVGDQEFIAFVEGQRSEDWVVAGVQP